MGTRTLHESGSWLSKSILSQFLYMFKLMTNNIIRYLCDCDLHQNKFLYLLHTCKKKPVQ